jgi:DEAD/DEAH box helicase domain-containing protein
VGLSAPLFDQRDEVVAAADALVSGCGCRFGCPACVGPILASDEERGYSPKAAALRVLGLLSDGASNRAEDGAPTGTTHVRIP